VLIGSAEDLIGAVMQYLRQLFYLSIPN